MVFIELHFYPCVCLETLLWGFEKNFNEKLSNNVDTFVNVSSVPYKFTFNEFFWQFFFCCGGDKFLKNYVSDMLNRVDGIAIPHSFSGQSSVGLLAELKNLGYESGQHTHRVCVYLPFVWLGKFLAGILWDVFYLFL